MNAIKYLIAVSLVIMLAGCREIQGPAWSPDGQWIAYTVYTHRTGGGFDTSVYLLNPDADNAAPQLLAEHAAFPQWAAGDSELFYLGERDAQGYYTKIMRYRPGEKPAVARDNIRMTAMQLAAGNQGPLLLLSQARDPQPGSMVFAELWNVSDNKRTDLRSLGEMSGPAISFNGKTIVYGSKPADGHAILMAQEISNIGVSEAKAVFPTASAAEPDAAGYAVYPFPNTERFLFCGLGLTNVWIMTGRPGSNKFAKFPIPPGLAGPIMARVAEDSNSANVTMLRATPGRMIFEPYRLDFGMSKWTRLEGMAEEPIGGSALDPNSKKREATRTAALSSAGLSIVDAGKPRWFPITAAQHVAASTLHLRANDPEAALDLAMKAQDIKPPPENTEALSQTLYAAYMASGKIERATDLYEQMWLLEPVGPSGVRFMFPPESGLPQPAPEWIAAESKKMDDLIAAAPENRMIPLLKMAFVARQKGNQRVAIDAYRKAMDYCPDKARIAGARFWQGVCELELGEPQQAGEMFEQAARIDDFPQADLAAALSAAAYLLHGRSESAAKASAVLQLPAAHKSAFAAEIGQIPSLLKGKLFKEHGATPESLSADGGVHAWAEYDSYWMPHVSTKPVRMDAGDGRFVNRHVGVMRMTASSIFTNKSPVPILRVARPVTAPKVASTGIALAFTVSGEVFPLPDNFCELIVLDPTGGVYSGNVQAAAAGHTRGRRILTQFAWNAGADIAVSGVEVDVFGGQKPYEKTVPLGRLTSVKK